MPKPTKEEMQGSKELELFNAALESLGIRPKDPKHPLAEFPPERLKSAVITTLGVSDVAWFKSFVEWFFEAYGYPITGRQVGAWLSNSKTMPAIQVARVADLVSRVIVDSQNSWLRETAEREMVSFDGYEVDLDPFSNSVLDKTRRGVVEALFFVDTATRIKIKRLALVASVLDMDEQALDALTAVAGLAKHDCWDAASSASANDGLEDAARFVSDIINRRDIAAECTELSDWAAKWSGMVNRPEPLDLPF